MNLIQDMVQEILRNHNNQVHTALVSLLTRMGISFPDIHLEQHLESEGGWTDVVYLGKPIMRYTMPMIVKEPDGPNIRTVFEYRWKIEILDPRMDEPL